MKKVTALLLSVIMMVCLLAGCGSGSTTTTQSGSKGGSADTQAGDTGTAKTDTADDAGADSAGTDQAGTAGTKGGDSGEPYTIAIEMLYFGMEDPDMQTVVDAINAITEPAINATVSFVPTSFGEMATKPGLWHSSGDKVDILMTGMMTTPQQLAEQGLLYPLDELLAGSETLTQLAGDLLSACRYKGVTYAYPLDLYPGNGQAFFYDEALAETYNIQLPESITTEADLESVLEQVKASGLSQYPMTYGDGVLAYQYYGYDMENFGDNYCSRGVIMNVDGNTTVENWYGSDTYKQMCQLHRDWYEKGYLVPDSLSNGYTYLDNMSQGTIFGFISSDGVSVGEAYYETQTGKKLGSIPMSEPVIRTSDVVVNTWGISSSCENPEKVLEFMELLYTNEELANLFNYGIEGQHYVKEENSRLINYPEGVNAMSAGYGTSVTTGSFGDRSILYAWADTWTEETLADVGRFGAKEGEVSTWLGFNYDMSTMVTENAAVMAVIQKYAPSLACGVVDVDDTLPKFLDELKKAGMGKIVEDTQKQVDAWLAQ